MVVMVLIPAFSLTLSLARLTSAANLGEKTQQFSL